MKPLNKDLIREIKKNFPRFISIVLLVGLGVMVLVGLAATGPLMRFNLEKKLDQAQMYDLFLSNSLGLEDQDIKQIAQLEDLEDVEFRYSVNRDVLGTNDAIHILSLTQKWAKPLLIQGRLPSQSGELALDRDYAAKKKMKIGDSISFKEVKNKYDLGKEEKPMVRDDFVLVGLVDSAEYLQTIHKGNQEDGTALEGFAYVSPNDFKLDNPTDALIGLKGARSLKTDSKDYRNLVLAGRQNLEDLFSRRPKDRLEAMKEDAQDQIQEGEEDLQSGKDKLQAAQDKLTSARQELAQGEKDYQKGQKTFKEEIAKGQGKIQKGQKDLDQGEKDLLANKNKLDDGEKKLKDSEKILAEKEADYQAGRDKYLMGLEQYRQGLDRIKTEEDRLIQGKKDLEENQAKLAQGQRDYQEGLAKLQGAQGEIQKNEESLKQARQALDQGRESLAREKEKLDQAQGAIDLGRSQVQKAKDAAQNAVQGLEKSLADKKSQLAALEASGGDPAEIARLKGEIQAGQVALDQAQKALVLANQALANYEKQIADQQKQVDQGRAKWQEGKKTLDQKEALYQEGLKKLNQGKEELEYNKGRIKASKDQLDQGLAQLGQGRKKLQDGQRQLDQGKSKLEDSQKTLEDAKESLDQGRVKLDQGKKDLDQGRGDLEKGKIQYAQGLEKVQGARDQLDQARRTLDQERQKGQDRLNATKKDLATGREKIRKGQKDYDEKAQEAQKDFDQAELDIKDAKELMTLLKRPMYTIYSRLSNPGIFNYMGYADSMDALVKLFPLFFFAISMLVSLTTMTRMVEEHRNYMGTLKALGFEKNQIAKKFYLYGLLAAIVGGVFGALLGNFFITPLIGNAYSTGTIVYPLEVKAYGWVIFFSILVGLACTGLVAYIITKRSLKESAASLMRPKPPAKGNRIFLEAIKPLWSRMTFLQKVTARNIFRYKMRMLMTLAGVMGCMALLVLGFGIYSAVFKLVDIQFNDLATYDMILIHERALSRDSYDKMMDRLGQDPQIKNKVPVKLSTMTMETKKQGTRTISLIASQEKDFNDLIRLRKPRGQGLTLPDRGALVTEKLAREEGLKKGSDLLVQDQEGLYRKIRIAGVVENYAGHYLYMTGDYYSQVMEEDYRDNGYLVSLKDQSPQGKKDFIQDYQGYKAVLSIASFDQVKGMVENLVGSLNVVVGVILVLSATLALVVLYNLTNINIEERIQELSTIKVLGFYPREVTAYVYRETWALTFIGIFLGGFVGKLLHWGVLQVVVPDDAMLYPVLTWWNFLLPAAITLFISFLVMVLVHNYLKKVDMVEALKGVE